MTLPRFYSNNVLYPNDLSPYWLESSFDITQVLKTLAKRSEKVSISTLEEPLFVSVVLDISDGGDIVLDASTDAEINAKACSEPSVRVHGFLNRVTIDFQITTGRIIEYDGAPALLFQAPSRLHKLQRREDLRVLTPMVKPLMCTFRAPDTTNQYSETREYQVQILDMSTRGICIQQPAGLFLQPGQDIKGCSVIIPESGLLNFDLGVRHVLDVENRLGTVSRRAGCEFTSLTPAEKQWVQNFILKLERGRPLVLK